MENDTIKQLLEQAEKMFQKDVLDAQKKRDNAIRIIQELSSGLYGDNQISDISSQETELVDDSNSKEYGSFTEKVKAMLPSLPQPFTRRDIIKRLNEDVNENTMTGCLHRLTKQGFIKKTVVGQGRTPSKYIRAKQDTLYE